MVDTRTDRMPRALFVRQLLATLRAHQWTKNGVLFAGLIFSRNAVDPALVVRSVAGFLVFCGVSSASYIVNDIVDLERDRLHPEKCRRPIASGAISPALALTLAVALFAVSLAGAARLGLGFALSALAYVGLILAYSLRLKRAVVLDVLVIAMGFVIRAIAGVAVLRAVDPSTELSPWLLICTLFLALFLATGKRRQEIDLLDSAAAGHRRTLSQYSTQLLDLMMAVLTAATVIAYAIYTIAPGTRDKFHSPALVYTVPFVVYGVFRYFYLVLERKSGGNPAEVLLTDGPLLINIVLWLAAVSVIIYVK